MPQKKRILLKEELMKEPENQTAEEKLNPKTPSPESSTQLESDDLVREAMENYPNLSEEEAREMIDAW